MPRCAPYGAGERGSLANVRWTVATWCAFAAVHATAAHAAPAPNPPASATPDAEADSEAAGAPAIEPRSDAAWQLYHQVFSALMQGEKTRARELASALLRDHPDHPATSLVRSAQLGLAPGAVDDHRDAADGHAGRETASRGARAELALFQSLHGIALGIEACLALECDSGQAYLGIALAGGAIGAVVALNLDDLTSGERALLNSGTAWGAVNAGLLLTAKQSGLGVQEASLTLIAGQTAGLLTGAALFKLHPTAGQVGLANSGGVWVGVLTELMVAVTGAHLDQSEQAITALIAIDAGIAGGAYLASRWPVISRAQTLVIDAGGIVGTVGGAALGVIIAGNGSDRTIPALAAVGTVAGLGAAAYFTRDWNDGGAGSLHGYVAPPEHGHGGIAGIGFVW
jgi:hypothetical protein